MSTEAARGIQPDMSTETARGFELTIEQMRIYTRWIDLKAYVLRAYVQVA